MEDFGPCGNFPVRVVRWPSEVVLFDRSVQPKLVVQFPEILVSSPTLLGSNQSFGHKANGIASIRLKILIDNSNGFWLFGLAK